MKPYMIRRLVVAGCVAFWCAVAAGAAHAELSPNCQNVLIESNTAFAAIDAARDGYTKETLTEKVAEKYFKSEAQNTVELYKLGEAAAQKGMTRDQAMSIVEKVNRETLAEHKYPHEAAVLLTKAGSAAVMCGFDDATQAF